MTAALPWKLYREGSMKDTNHKVKQNWKPFRQLIKKARLPYGKILLCVLASLLVAQLNLMFPDYTEQITSGDFSTRTIVLTIIVVAVGAVTLCMMF